jgi:DUF4097 and DUF4098 domain-containing protein YvlB
MKRIYLVGLMTVAFLIAAGLPVFAQDAPITVAFSDPSRPGLLKVHLMQGSLSVRTHAGNNVIVTSKSKPESRRSNSRAEQQGLRRLDAVSTGLTIEEQNNVMNIGSSRMSNSVDIDIQVPVKTNLNLSVLNGDDITVQGVDGDIDINNNNGNITATDVAGSVLAYSLNGDVKVSMKRVTAQKPMSFSSLNGDIDVTLPGDTKANLKLKADNGDVYTDFDVQIRPSAAPTVEDTRSKGGRIRINVDKSLTGAINGGGPDFVVQTRNGNVYIRKVK